MTRRRVLYVAHPVAPSPEQLADLTAPRGWLATNQAVGVLTECNLESALNWYTWFRASFPETTFVMPWYATIRSVGGDGTPAEREAGLVDACAVVERCDGIVLCGGRISSGMRREMEHGLARGLDDFAVYDLTTLPPAAPTQPAWFKRTAAARTFEIWIKQGCKIWELANKR